MALVAIYYKRNKDKEEKMKELHVNWDEIDGEYREDPPFGTGFSVGSTTLNHAGTPYTVSEKPDQSIHTYSPALADSNMVKPDVYEDIPTKTKPDDTQK